MKRCILRGCLGLSIVLALGCQSKNRESNPVSGPGSGLVIHLPKELPPEPNPASMSLRLGWDGDAPGLLLWHGRTIIAAPHPTSANRPWMIEQPFFVPESLPTKIVVNLPTETTQYMDPASMNGSAVLHWTDASGTPRSSARTNAENTPGAPLELSLNHLESFDSRAESRKDETLELALTDPKQPQKALIISIPLRRPPREIEVKVSTVTDFEQNHPAIFPSLKTRTIDATVFHLLGVLEAYNPHSQPIVFGNQGRLGAQLLAQFWRYSGKEVKDIESSNCSYTRTDGALTEAWSEQTLLLPLESSLPGIGPIGINAGQSRLIGLYGSTSSALESSLRLGYQKRHPEQKSVITSCHATCSRFNDLLQTNCGVSSLSRPFCQEMTNLCFGQCSSAPSAGCDACRKLEAVAGPRGPGRYFSRCTNDWRSDSVTEIVPDGLESRGVAVIFTEPGRSLPVAFLPPIPSETPEYRSFLIFKSALPLFE